jgi:hypothetical protein
MFIFRRQWGALHSTIDDHEALVICLPVVQRINPIYSKVAIRPITLNCNWEITAEEYSIRFKFTLIITCAKSRQQFQEITRQLDSILGK